MGGKFQDEKRSKEIASIAADHLRKGDSLEDVLSMVVFCLNMVDGSDSEAVVFLLYRAFYMFLRQTFPVVPKSLLLSG